MKRTTGLRSSWLLPGVAGILVLLVSIYLWNALKVDQERQIQDTTAVETSAIMNHISSEITARSQSLDRMAARWEFQGRHSQAQWEHEALLNIADYPGSKALLWIDANNRVTWVVPLKGNQGIPRGAIIHDEVRREGLDRAKGTSSPVISRPLDLHESGRGFVAYRSLYINNDPGRFDGYVAATFLYSDFFDIILENPLVDGYAIAVLHEGEEVYLRSSEERANEAEWSGTQVASLYGADWQIRVWPESAALARQQSYLPVLILLAGILSAVLIAISIRMAQVAQIRTRQAQAISSELNVSALALEQSNKELEQFAYVASHDLKAPLVSLRGMADILIEDYGDVMPSDARMFMDRISANASKMQTLLDDVLQMSRLRQVEVPFSAVDLNSIVKSVTEQLGQLLESRGATVRVLDTLPIVQGNTMWMIQIFTNLIDNGVKYTSSDRLPLIEIGCHERDDVWEVFIRDNGPGIPLAYTNRVFGMFQRLPDGKTVNPGGSGMGLAIVARGVEAHGGKVWIDSTSDAGTTFAFTVARDNVGEDSIRATASPVKAGLTS